MKQLTVRGVNDELHRALQNEAERLGVSVNGLVLKFLKESVGLAYETISRDQEFDDLDFLIGAWSQADEEEFAGLLQTQRTVDPELWS